MQMGKSTKFKTLKKRLKVWYRGVFSHRQLSKRTSQIKQWFQSPLGSYILNIEDRCLDKLASEHYSQRMLHITVVEDSQLSSSTPFKRIVRVYSNLPGESEESNKHVCAISEFDSLPFESESFDIVVIQHAIEFSHNPQQVLKEAVRITSHGGHIAILAFNPLSLTGICNLLWGRVRPASVSYRQNLLKYRFKDWLRFLECSHLRTLNICHTAPVNHLASIRAFSGFGQLMDRYNLPFSSVFCLVSRKDVACRPTAKRDWRKEVFPSGLVIPKAVQSLKQPYRLSKVRKNN